MAIHNDSRIYSGGNVVFNEAPHVALYADLMKRKQAKDEAFDEYIRGLNKEINPAGVRNIDMPILNDKIAKWQEYGMKNREDMKNRKNGADIAFQKGFQDIRNDIAESKAEEEKKKPLVGMLVDPDKRDRIGEGAIAEINAHDQPLYIKDANGNAVRNPNRKSLDYTSLSFNPKPFEQDKYFKGFQDIKRMEMPPIISTDPKTLTQTETKNAIFDQDAKNLAAQRAVTEYAENHSFKSFIDKLDPKEYNDFYKQNFGHDIKTPGDLAAAYTLKGLQQTVTTSKVNPDTFGRQKAMAAITDQYARGRLALQQQYKKDFLAYKGAASKKEADSILEGYINRAFDEGKGSSTVVGVKGDLVPARNIVVPKEITEKYTISKGNTDEKVPTKFMMTEDKKYVIPVYGNEHTVDKRNHIPIETFRNDLAKLWLSKKDAATEIGDDLDFGDDEGDQGGGGSAAPVTSHPLPAGKPATVKQGGHIYTYNPNTGNYE